MPASLPLLFILLAVLPAQEEGATPSEKDWLVKIELTAFVVPEKLGLEVLDELPDEKGSAAAYQKVRAALDRGEAKLVDSPMVSTAHGVERTAYSGQVLRYPVTFDQADYPDFGKPGDLRRLPKDLKVLEFPPSETEERILGVQLTAAPEISKNGAWLRITAQAEHTRFIKWDEIEGGVTPSGTRIVASQPRFWSLRTQGSYYLRNGGRTLAGAHKLPGAKNPAMELFFLRATTVPKPPTPLAPLPPAPPPEPTTRPAEPPPPALPCNAVCR